MQIEDVKMDPRQHHAKVDMRDVPKGGLFSYSQRLGMALNRLPSKTPCVMIITRHARPVVILAISKMTAFSLTSLQIPFFVLAGMWAI